MAARIGVTRPTRTDLGRAGSPLHAGSRGKLNDGAHRSDAPYLLRPKRVSSNGFTERANIDVQR
jgi:hypothetical protein